MRKAITKRLQLRNHFLKHKTESSKIASQPTITCSKLTTETLEQGVRYVQFENLKVTLSQENYS